MGREPRNRARSESLEIRIGAAARPVGRLDYLRQGRRELSQFAYHDAWLGDPDRFEISPDLPLERGYRSRRATGPDASVFHHALADTEPDAWGRRVIERAHARARREDPGLEPLDALDYLCAVDDFSRVGALRLAKGERYLRSAGEGEPATPPIVEIERIYEATRAVEASRETAADLRYLQGKATSLGGMRPKCTVLDEHGRLAIGKFPSLADTINVTRAEALALRLARRAGIESADARCVTFGGAPVLIVERFDRAEGGRRIPYLSAASMLLADPREERAYTEIVDVMRARCARPDDDARELWRRLAFNLLITNTDDHLRNLGFLYDGNGMWRLAPAFDVNPMPGRIRESKTWLSEDTGPIVSVDMLLERCRYFALTPARALTILGEVLDAVAGWKTLARSPAVGLSAGEIGDLEDAFEHEQTAEARRLTGRH